MEDTRRATVTLEGPPAVVDTVLTLLRYIETCGRLGTTRWVDLMIDGDGGARLAVSIDGASRPLTDAEIAYLFEGEGARTPELRAQCVRAEAADDGARLRVELV